MQDNNQTHDNSLWEDFISGNNDAFEDLYNKHIKAMYVYGLYITKDHSLIEDAIHDVFVKLHNNRKNLPSSVTNIKYYLLIALRNNLMNEFKSKKINVNVVVDDILPSMEESAEEKIIQKEAQNRKEAILQTLQKSLSERQRQIIYYRYIEQFSYKEIADLMNINIQSAKNLMQTTLAKLRASFSDSDKFIISLIVFVLS